MQFVTHFAQVQKGEDRRGRAAFHVARAAPVDAAIDQFAAPRVVRPAGAVADREAVDMTVKRQVTSGFPGFERRYDVWHHLARRDHTIVSTMPRQEPADMVRCLARVAGRVRARTADKATQKIEQHITVTLDPLQQLRLPPSMSHCPVAFYPVKRSGNLWAG